MIPVNFEGAVTIGKPESMTDEQCSNIYAAHGIDESGYRYFIEAWKPSYEDIQAINRGEPIWVRIISNGLPPIAMWTVNENGDCNDQ